MAESYRESQLMISNARHQSVKRTLKLVGDLAHCRHLQKMAGPN